MAERRGWARIDALRSSLSVVAIIALIALFTTLSIPTRQPKGAAPLRPVRRWERSEKFNQPFDHQQTAQDAKRGHGDATPVMPDRSLGPVDRVLRPIGSDCEAE